MDMATKERRRAAANGASRAAQKKSSDGPDESAAASSSAFNPIAQAAAAAAAVAFAPDAAVDGMAPAPVDASELQASAAQTGTTGEEAVAAVAPAPFTSLLGERKREEDDEELPVDNDDEDENPEEEEEADPAARMLAIAEEETGTLVQCPPLEPCFESWEDFHRAMEGYCIATHQPMRLRTSDSAKAVNLRAAKRNSLKEPIDESVGFVKKLYLCTHGVKTKPRGKGKRPRQHYRYMGCPAMIRACISERKPGDSDGESKYVVRVVAQVSAAVIVFVAGRWDDDVRSEGGSSVLLGIPDQQAQPPPERAPVQVVLGEPRGDRRRADRVSGARARQGGGGHAQHVGCAVGGRPAARRCSRADARRRHAQGQRFDADCCCGIECR